MKTETDYYIDLYQCRAKRIRRNVLVLILLLGLVTVDGLSQVFKTNDYNQRLPMVLYDFTVKYEDALVEWWRGQAEINQELDLSDQKARITIPFDNALGNAGNINWYAIPFLESYLDMHLPEIQAGQEISDFRLDYPLYLFVIVLLPVFILLWIYLDSRSLYKLRVKIISAHDNNDVIRAIIQSVIFSRINSKVGEHIWFRSIAFSLLLFVVGTLISLIPLSAPYSTHTIVQGSLVINPPGRPFLKIQNLVDDKKAFQEFREARKKNSDFYSYLMIFAFLINLLCAILIARELSKKPV